MELSRISCWGTADASNGSSFWVLVPFVTGGVGFEVAVVVPDVVPFEEGIFLSTVAVFSASAASGERSETSVSDRSVSSLWNKGFGGDLLVIWGVNWKGKRTKYN